MRIVSLIFIAIITFVIVLAVKRPEFFKDFWLWLVGLSGLIVHALQVVWNYVKTLFSKTFESAVRKETEVIAKLQNKV